MKKETLDKGNKLSNEIGNLEILVDLLIGQKNTTYSDDWSIKYLDINTKKQIRLVLEEAIKNKKEQFETLN